MTSLAIVHVLWSIITGLAFVGGFAYGMREGYEMGSTVNVKKKR